MSGGGSLRLVHRLGHRQAAGASRALAEGRDVACLSVDPEVAETLAAVRVLPQGSLPAFEEAAQIPGAFELAELAVQELLRRRPALARRLERLAGGEDDLYRYLCRLMLREVAGVLAVAELVDSPPLAAYEQVVVDRQWPNGPDFAFLRELARREGVALPPPIAAALERLTFEAAGAPLGVRMRAVGRVAHDAVGLWADWLRRIRGTAVPLPERPLLIRTYASDYGLDRGGQRRLRNVDFVVDGETIRPSEVGVWAEEGVPPERDRELAARGYGVLRRELVTVGLVGFAARVLPRLVAATALLARLALAETWWRQPVANLCSQSLLWGEVARRVRPRAMLVVNDLHPTGVARTLALRRGGCRTILYEFASSWALDESGWVPDFVYGFTVADVLVTWGPLHTRTFARHRGSIGEYWELGCLWAEHARLVRDDAAVGAPFREALAREYGVPPGRYASVVSVFDTSLAPLLLHVEDMVAFYGGVAALAGRMPEALFLCKPKFPLDGVLGAHPDWPNVAAALAALENLVVLDSHFETAAAIGLSDLSINACYTSPAIETIGAGRPALYFDPTARFPDAFLRRIPDFVAATEDELETLARRRLAAGEDATRSDLEARFADLEGHFDGLAITRLRERLRAVLDA